MVRWENDDEGDCSCYVNCRFKTEHVNGKLRLVGSDAEKANCHGPVADSGYVTHVGRSNFQMVPRFVHTNKFKMVPLSDRCRGVCKAPDYFTTTTDISGRPVDLQTCTKYVKDVHSPQSGGLAELQKEELNCKYIFTLFQSAIYHYIFTYCRKCKTSFKSMTVKGCFTVLM